MIGLVTSTQKQLVRQGKRNDKHTRNHARQNQNEEETTAKTRRKELSQKRSIHRKASKLQEAARKRHNNQQNPQYKKIPLRTKNLKETNHTHNTKQKQKGDETMYQRAPAFKRKKEKTLEHRNHNRKPHNTQKAVDILSFHFHELFSFFYNYFFS